MRVIETIIESEREQDLIANVGHVMSSLSFSKAPLELLLLPPLLHRHNYSGRISSNDRQQQCIEERDVPAGGGLQGVW